MKDYKLKLLLKEFPFLAKLSELRWGEHFASININQLNVKIQRADKPLFCQSSYLECGYLGEYYVFLISYNDKVEMLPDDCYIDVDDYEVKCTLGDLLAKKASEGIIADYVMACSCYNTNDDDSEAVYRWTIYKMSDFDQIEYMCSLVDKAADELKNESFPDFISLRELHVLKSLGVTSPKGLLNNSTPLRSSRYATNWEQKYEFCLFTGWPSIIPRSPAKL